MSSPKFVEEAMQKIRDAALALEDVHKAWGRGAGGREAALAVTNAQQAALWMQEANKKATEASTPAKAED